MWGDMDPKNWSVGDWVMFLFRVLVPTAIVVAWIVMLVMEY